MFASDGNWVYAFFNPRVMKPQIFDLKYCTHIYMFTGFPKRLWQERDPESHFGDVFYIGFLLFNKVNFNKVSCHSVIEKYLYLHTNV